jgi:hypothetical protein
MRKVVILLKNFYPLSINYYLRLKALTNTRNDIRVSQIGLLHQNS